MKIALEENDIFVTPPKAHAIASEAVGWNTATAFDPCAAPADIGRDANGRLVDGLCLRFASQTFCNPPFSRSREWIPKCALEVFENKQREVVLLISADDYLRGRGEWREELMEYHNLVVIEPIKWCAHPLGIIHDFKWRNFMTNKRGGPRFGVVLLHLRHRDEEPTDVGSLIKKFEVELQVS